METHRNRQRTVSAWYFRIAFLTSLSVLALAGTARSQDPFIGEIRMFGGNFEPRGWALCNGQLLSIAQNSALFSLLGTTYGGDGRTTFALPDLRGRVPIHFGTGPGLSPRDLGEIGGQEQATITVAQMPSHTHAITLRADSTVATSDKPQGMFPSRDASSTPSYGDTANATLNSNAASAGSTGGSQPVSIMQPYTCVNFIIALQGIYPSRN